MKTFVALSTLFALTQAASLLPLESSVVHVKSERNGQDYSYSIQENRRGIPIEHIPLQAAAILQPVAATAEIKTLVEHQQGLALPQLQQGGQAQNDALEIQQDLKSRQPDKRIQAIQQRPNTILPLQLRQEQYIPIQYTALSGAYYPLAYQQYQQYYYPYNIPLQQQYLYRI